MLILSIAIALLGHLGSYTWCHKCNMYMQPMCFVFDLVMDVDRHTEHVIQQVVMSTGLSLA